MSLSCPNTKTKLENPFIDDVILKEDNFIEGDDDNLEPNDIVKIIRKRHTYTIEEKLFFVKLMDKKYKKISRNIRDNDKRPGVEPKTAMIETDLLSYIKLCRGLEIAIGTNEIIFKAYELMPALRELSCCGIHTWAQRFLRRYNYTLRVHNKVGVVIKENSSEKAAEFLLYCHQYLKDNEIGEGTPYLANMDETPIWYEMNYKKTIESIGNKNVNVKTFNCDKLRISLILTILLNGTKLAPLVVIKGKQEVVRKRITK